MSKIFVSRQVSNDFATLSEKLPLANRKKFAQAVRDLFDRKITSEEGEFSEFYITNADLRSLFVRFATK